MVAAILISWFASTSITAAESSLLSATTAVGRSDASQEFGFSSGDRSYGSLTDATFSHDGTDYTIKLQNAEPSRPTALSAQPGDTQVTVEWTDTNNPLTTTYQLLQLPQNKLTADDGAANDEFAYSAAIDGNTVVIGARGDESNKGAAYVFTRDSSDDWSQAAKLTADDGAVNDEFAYSVAIDGNTVVIGARGDESNKGAAYVFTRDSSDDWSQAAKLTKSVGVDLDEFGYSVAIDGNTVVIGARGDESNKGAAYVFTKPGTGWTTTDTTGAAKLTADDGAANDEFAYSVAIDGNTVVIGARGDESNKGAAYVFTRDSSDDWSQAAKLTKSVGVDLDEFGYSVAIDGNTVVIGARGDESNKGAAYVFTKPGTGWTTTDTTGAAKLTASDGAANDEFAYSVAVDGDTVVVGAYREDDSHTGIVSDDTDSDPGAAYVFTGTSSGVWSETLKLKATDGLSGDKFGYSVAVAGKTVLVGAKDDDANVTDSGSAYVIGIADWTNLDIDVPDADENGRREYSYRVTGLTNDQEYVFRVRAVNAVGNTRSGEIVSATPRLARPDKPERLSATAGNGRVRLSWNRSDDSTITGYQELHYVIGKLTASDRAVNDNFGHSVAMDDGTAVIGANRHDGKGAAYVFTRDSSGVWRQVAKLTAYDGEANDEFGYSVAIDGDTVVIGARQGDSTDDLNNVVSDSGSAYVFTEPDTGWADSNAAAKLTAYDGEANDEFGYSVAIDGDTVVIGARQGDSTDDLNNVVSDSGSAYVFTEPDTGWADSNAAAKLTAYDGATLDRFGYSVAIDGDTVVIGARQGDSTDDDNNVVSDSGSAYVFTEPDTGWADSNAAAKLTADDGKARGYFGHSVAVDDKTVVVGARGDDNSKGAAYVFTEPGTGWANSNVAAKLTASDGKADDEFGYSVAVNGTTAVIGAYYDDLDDDDYDDHEGNSGSAYVFTEPETGGWVDSTETAKLTLPVILTVILTGDREVVKVVREEDDLFGTSVAVDGESIMVGAPGVDDGSGSIHVLGIPQWGEAFGNADTTSYTAAGLTNGTQYSFQVRAVDDVGVTTSDIVRATPWAPSPVFNRSPSFVDGNSVARTVAENTAPGGSVGRAVAAIDPDGDSLTYSLSGADASLFDVVAATGQIIVGSGTVLDFESGITSYTVIVSVHDGKAWYGGADSEIDDSIDVTINVANEADFGDVEAGSHKPAIDALDGVGLFEGTLCGEGMFCPGEPIERSVMAVWLIRALGDADVGAAAVGSSRFADVDAAEWWAPFVERLAQLELTVGCRQEPLRYCPHRVASRAQVASFLVRAFDLGEAPSSAGFVDTAGSTHESNIDALAASGITVGCSQEPLRFCPDEPVSRAQMASLLARALGLVEAP